MLALAVIHHIVISNNVSMDMPADFAGFAPLLIIEFLDVSDSNSRKPLRAMPHRSPEYTYANFLRSFSRRFDVSNEETLPGTDRHLLVLRRRGEPSVI